MSRRAGVAVMVLAGCFGLAASQPVFAAPEEGNGKRAEVRQKVLQKFDKNGNGQMDPDEKEAAKEAMQKRREQGGGKGPGRQGGPDPERRQKLLEKFDTDGDGKLSETERATAKAARPKRRQRRRFVCTVHCIQGLTRRDSRTCSRLTGPASCTSP